MNEHDTERVAGLFEADGMSPPTASRAPTWSTSTPACIRENADNRMYGNLGQMKAIKDINPEHALVVGGCVAQKDRQLVRERAPWVDVVMGTHNLDRVLDLIDHAEQWGPITEVVDELQAMPSSLPVKRELEHSAWVTIQVGCNNTCTFCIVPSVRGVEVSRRPGDIVREVERLAAEGVVEVTLLGQNVDTYGRDLALDGHRRPMFGELLRRVGAVDGIRRVRFTSPHPNDFREDVALAMAETEAVCEHLHFPLQSGSDRVLAAMHRGYNPAQVSGPSGDGPRHHSRPRGLHRHHRGLSRGDRRGLRPDTRGHRRGGLRLGVHVHLLAPTRHQGRGHGRPTSCPMR